MELIIGIVVFVIVGYFVYLLGKKFSAPINLLLIGWAIKFLVSIFYVYIFTTYYGEGERIQGDSQNFYYDSKILNDLFYKNKSLYFKSLFGISGDEKELSNDYLKSTHIWDAGDNGDWINDNRLIIRINSVIHFFSFDNLYVHVLLMSFMSFIGLLLLYESFQFYISYKKTYLILLFLTPTIAFWGSGLTKECLLILGFGMFTYSLVNLLKHPFKIKSILFLTISLFILLFNKPYAGLVIVSVSSVFLFGYISLWRKKIMIYFSLGLIAFFVTLTYTPDPINLTNKISYRQNDMINLAQGGIFFVTDSSFCSFDHKFVSNFDTLNQKIIVKENTSGLYKLFGTEEFLPFTINESEKWYDLYLMINPSSSFFETTVINYKSTNLLISIPEVLFNTLIRPFPTDNGSSFKLIVFLQNLFIISIILFALLNKKVVQNFEAYLVYYLLIMALIVLLIVGWTTPVFGAIARYKIPVDIALITAAFILMRDRTQKIIS